MRTSPSPPRPAFSPSSTDLYADLHSRNLRLYLNTPVGDPDYDIAALAVHSDGLLLMDYDQHQQASVPGPIASQDWFLDNLQQTLKIVPKEKIILAIGSYGYDWTAQPRAAPP